MTNKDTLIAVAGNRYGNDVGKAVVIDPDYKGFPTHKGALVSFIDRADHVGFVSFSDFTVVPLLDPRRKTNNPFPVIPAPAENKTSNDVQTAYNNSPLNRPDKYDYFYSSTSAIFTPRLAREIAETEIPTRVVNPGALINESDFISLRDFEMARQEIQNMHVVDQLAMSWGDNDDDVPL